jgi:hypothetical protein
MVQVVIDPIGRTHQLCDFSSPQCRLHDDAMCPPSQSFGSIGLTHISRSKPPNHFIHHTTWCGRVFDLRQSLTCLLFPLMGRLLDLFLSCLTQPMSSPSPWCALSFPCLCEPSWLRLDSSGPIVQAYSCSPFASTGSSIGVWTFRLTATSHCRPSCHIHHIHITSQEQHQSTPCCQSLITKKWPPQVRWQHTTQLWVWKNKIRRKEK